jgi:hypothetical protein
MKKHYGTFKFFFNGIYLGGAQSIRSGTAELKYEDAQFL